MISAYDYSQLLPKMESKSTTDEINENDETLDPKLNLEHNNPSSTCQIKCKGTPCSPACQKVCAKNVCKLECTLSSAKCSRQ